MTDYTDNIRLVLPVFDQNPWDEDVNTNFRTIDTAFGNITAAAPEGDETTARIAAMRGHIYGLTTSYYNTLGVGIAAGTCTDSTGTDSITLAAPLVKSIATAWVAGDLLGAMGTGLTATLNTWYHVFVFKTAALVDVYFDTSVTAANKPVGTTAFRRIGSFKLDGSVHVKAFTQFGDTFLWSIPINEASGVPGITTPYAQALSGVPLGVNVKVQLSGTIGDAVTPSVLYIYSPSQGDATVGGATAITAVSGIITDSTQAFDAEVITDTFAQIKARVTTVTAFVNINTNGWIDTRGKD